MVKLASIVCLVLAAIDAGYLCVWAIKRSINWSTVVDNFLSDVGKVEVGTWHVEHVQSVDGDYGRVALHALIMVVLIVIAAVLFANRRNAS